MKAHTRKQKQLAKKVHMRNPRNVLYPSNFTATWCGAWLSTATRFTSDGSKVTCRVCQRNAADFTLQRLTT
jgi:hypothetical protein